MLFYDGYLYVADEPAGAVKVYDGTGQLQGQIAGGKLKAGTVTPSDGSGKGKDFITGLPDEPEFILYVPSEQ